MNESREPPFLRVSGVSKTFAGVTVLRDIALEIAPGEIRGLVGQNGSGKSTLIKILSGYHRPDAGAHIEVDGQVLDRAIDPANVGEHRFAFIHQDLALVPGMSILENMRIGHFETGAAGRVLWHRERQIVAEQLLEVQVHADPDMQLGRLPTVEQALIAIARGVANVRQASGANGRHAGLLVLDEPTAYLPADGLDRLVRVLRSLAASGISVLIVSHRLDEIMEVADSVTVLRDGRLIETVRTADTSASDLITSILGQRLESLYPEVPEAKADTSLRVDGLVGERMQPLSFDMRRGEVLGFTGLAGMGYEEIPYLLTGAARARAGALTLIDADGQERIFDLADLTPRQTIERGMYLLPSDRAGASGVGSLDVVENLTLPFIDDFTRSLVIQQDREEEAARHILRRFRVMPEEPFRPLRTLSGGNQQKLLLAKWMQASPKYLALHEPTQGVDMGAKKQIFRCIVEAAAAGTTVLVVSVEYEDLAHICDRVIVVRGGRVARDLRDAELTVARVATAVFEAA